MGYKSTTKLNRDDAITRLVDLRVEQFESALKTTYSLFTDKQIEDALEEALDEKCEKEDSTNYENFLIVEYPQ